MVKSAIREIKTSFARWLAILAIIALGVGFYSGLQMCRPDMIRTASDYYEDYNLYDYELMSTYGIDEESVEIAKSAEGVADAEPAIEQDLIANVGSNEETMLLKALSLPKNINTLNLCSGRLPEAPDECVVDNYGMAGGALLNSGTVKVSDLNDEDTLDMFAVKEFKIVGTVNTPLYLDYERGSTDIGNGSLDTFIYLPKESFDTDYYTQLYIKLKGNETSFTDALDNKIDRYEDPMEDLAENITSARRETERSKAQDELNDKKTEYNDGVDEYNSQKKSAEAKLNKAQSDIDSGQSTVNKNRKETQEAIDDLNEKKTQVEAGIAEAQAGLVEIENGIKLTQEDISVYKSKPQPLSTEDELAYQTALATLGELQTEKATTEATINGLNSNLEQLNGGLEQAEAGMQEIGKAQTQLDKGQKELNAQRKSAMRKFASARAELDDAKVKLDDAQKEIDDLDDGDSYSLSRKDNAGYATFDQNAMIVSNIAKIFPAFFFLVAALVCMTTMTRMIDEQRSQIGIFKALGYSNRAVLSKYLFYSGSAGFIGSVIGFFAGCYIFPTVIWHAYTMMYDFSADTAILFDWKLGLGCLAVALLCSMGVTLVCCMSDFGVAPAQLIRPKTPPAGKRILLERITPIWNRLSFLYKVSFRNVFRYKKRFFMMVLGVSGCTALLIAGFGINTSIKGVAKFQYDEVIQYDYQIIFDQDMDGYTQADFAEYADEEAEKYGRSLFVHSGTATMDTGKNSFDVTLVASDSKDITEYVDLHDGDEQLAYPGDGEIVVCRKLQSQFGINKGDMVTLKNGYNEMTAKVSGVFDNYVSEVAYMTASTYKAGFGEASENKTAFVIAPDDAADETIRENAATLSQYDHAAAAVVNLDMLDRVDSMMESLNLVIYVVILCAALLAFIVLYNLTNINITERIREIATIKVLGFHRGETSSYVFRENFFLTAIAAIVGVPLGKWLLNFVIKNINVNMIFFVSRITWQDYMWSIVLTFVFAAVVGLAMMPRLNKVSMTESLKSIE